MSKKSDISLYFLGASRGIRIAWLLEELDLDYKLIAAPRAKNGLAPPEFKAKIPNPLGKSPTIQDGGIVVTESGAIVEYLCENYDTEHRLLPTDAQQRAKVREWVAAAEGTFMLHSMAILYARWRIPDAGQNLLPEMEENLSANVINNFKWLERELKAQKETGSGFLVGQHITAADVMMQFSIQFITERELGIKGRNDSRWPLVMEWLERIEQSSTYRKAVQKTGYTLDGDFKK